MPTLRTKIRVRREGGHPGLRRIAFPLLATAFVDIDNLVVPLTLLTVVSVATAGWLVVQNRSTSLPIAG